MSAIDLEFVGTISVLVTAVGPSVDFNDSSVGDNSSFDMPNDVSNVIIAAFACVLPSFER